MSDPRGLATKFGEQWFRWHEGRLGTGYQKLLLATSPWLVPFDLYVLRFRPGAEAPPHLDEVPRGRHFRLNVVLKRAKLGGEFWCERTLFQVGPVVLFRPDKYRHSVKRVEQGTRYVLSLGWVV